MPTIRRLPVGAEPIQSGGVHFRVWAPIRKAVEVVLEGGTTARLQSERSGYFSGLVPEANVGSRYQFRLDEGDAFPDPASRFQPDGPHGHSQVIDPTTFSWRDHDWTGVERDGQIIYEMHVGTFTKEGTWAAAIEKLAMLKELGVTVIEVMPLAEFPGKFGWGYDGVNWFAPTRLYGQPDDFRQFVNTAHRHGIGVILDVVYNHFGPDGNYLGQYSTAYVSTKYKNEWGDPINFDGPDCGPVREYVVANVEHWITEYHLDGLRLDATQQIFDASHRHILAELTQKAREVAKHRNVFIVAEDETQNSTLIREFTKGGYGLDAAWNDDFHHSAVVALTGKNEAYYTDYRGRAHEFVAAMKHGFLYQGQRYKWQKKCRGTPTLDQPPTSFVTFLENHDQVSNSPTGKRIHQLTSPGRLRAMTALLLLGPETPMLFQGQEFASSAPFLFFADHNPDLAKLVRKGRREFLSQFRSLAKPEAQALVPDPSDVATFSRCQLNWAETETNKQWFTFHRDLIKLRRGNLIFRHDGRARFDAAVLTDSCFLLRYFALDGFDYLLIVNIGRDEHLDIAPEPMLAPPSHARWHQLWSSDDRKYGGSGLTELETEENWRIPAESATLFMATTLEEASD